MKLTKDEFYCYECGEKNRFRVEDGFLVCPNCGFRFPLADFERIHGKVEIMEV